MELTDGPAPPPELAVRTFAAAFARREPGATAVPEALAVSAYRAQGDELSALLLDLSPGEWDAPTLSGFTVAELVGHLLAIEAYVASILGVAPPPGLAPFEVPAGLEDDHRAVTEPTITAHAGVTPDDVVAEWWAWVDANVAHLATLGEDALDDRVLLHGLDLSLRSMLGARVFEMWTHADDIRRATGRPLRAPAAHHLAFMSALAVGALPLGLLLAGIDDPGRTVRVVLTGDGGGEFVQTLTVGGTPGTPDATVTADVVDFCRLAAQRLTPAELRHEVMGDAGTVADVLVGAGVFAA